MNRLAHSPLHGSVFALSLTSVALMVSLLLRPVLEPDIYLLFLVAVWLSAWYYGRAIGFLATGAASVLLLAFFLLPIRAPYWAVSARLGSFFVIASLINWVTAAWRESRRMLASTLASITDKDGHITFLNPVAETITGWPGEEARGKTAEDILRLIDERTRQTMENPLTRALRDRVVVTTAAHTVLISRGGAEVPIEHNAAPVRGGSGEVVGAILVFRDTSKRRQFEEQATHTQKMEAVGRLAGGVSGDFNNMLTVISGYAELLRGEIPPHSASRKYVDEIIYAGERAAALTRHLLAFSRGSAAEPRVLDLNLMLTSMQPMLQRLLGETIELLVLTTPGLGRIHADPSQIEQIIVNLANNARDAMPTGGKLVIETANVELEAQNSKHLGMNPGAYVMMAVSDTGMGMDPETRSRLFEPFFTTKTPGKGSGLGLATVYGTVKQAGGQVTVYSQLNCGTIFEFYLPRVMESAGELVAKRSAKGSETILLVDDEEGVRKLCCAVLQSNGYSVLEAGNGSSALAAYDKNAHKVDLLLTDVVMPMMSGFELGRRLTERTFGLKILYMSGYRENNSSGTPGETPIAFLHKPFTPDALLAKVREVLDGASV